MSRIGSPLEWIIGALRLDTANPPSEFLDSEGVVPMADVLQGGHAIASNAEYVTQLHPASTAATQYTMLAHDREFQHVIWFMGINVSPTVPAGAPNENIYFTLRGQGAQGTYFFNAPLVVGNTPIVPSTRFGSQPLIIPPDVALVWGAPATGVGETARLSLLVTRVRRGFKPW